MASPSSSDVSLAPDASAHAVSPRSNRGQQVSQNQTHKGRKPLAESWNKLNINVMGTPIELLNNNRKKRSRDLEQNLDDDDNQPSKRSLTLDPATLAFLREGIVEALSDKVQLTIESKLSIINELRTELTELKKSSAASLQKISEEITAKENNYKSKFDSMDDRLARLESKLHNDSPPPISQRSTPATESSSLADATFKNHLELINKKLETFDKQCRQCNIIIKGLDVTHTHRHNLRTYVDNFLLDNFAVSNCVEHVTLIGKFGNMIKAKLTSQTLKTEIMKKKKSLGTKKIYIDHDRTPEERKAEYDARQKARQQRQALNGHPMGTSHGSSSSPMDLDNTTGNTTSSSPSSSDGYPQHTTSTAATHRSIPPKN